MHGKSLNGYPFRVEANVNARVIGPNKKIKQNIEKHNMATANLTEGVVKFLRGEFTESYISGLIPNIGNDFNIADQYIPAYMGMGCIGVSKDDSGNLLVTPGSHMAPSYADTQLLREIVPLSNPSRAIVSKSVRSNTLLSQASTLMISAAYHFEDPAEAQRFYIEPQTEVHKNDKLYISSTVFPGERQLQRIKSVQPMTAGWSVETNVPLSEADGYRGSLHLIYTNPDKLDTEVLELNLDTGVLTALTDFTFITGLELYYDPINFDFKFTDSLEPVPFMQNGMTRTYYITELGLFSGNLSNDQSKLMARVVLDPETPLIIDENDYVVITWQIGVYALEDALYEEDITGDVVETDTYKYVTQNEPTTMGWSELKLDANGNVIEEATSTEMRASFDIVSMDYLNSGGTEPDVLRLSLNSVNGLFIGQEMSFTAPNGKDISGVISNIYGEQRVPNFDWVANANNFYLPEGIYQVLDLTKTIDDYSNYKSSSLVVKLNPQVDTASEERQELETEIKLSSQEHYNSIYNSVINPYYNLLTKTIQSKPAENRFIYINKNKVYLLNNTPLEYPNSIELTISDKAYSDNALQCLTSTAELNWQVEGLCRYKNLTDINARNILSGYTSFKIEDITDYSKLDGLSKEPPVSSCAWEQQLNDTSTNSAEPLEFKSPFYIYRFGIDPEESSSISDAVYYKLPDIPSCVQSDDLQPLHLVYTITPVPYNALVSSNGISTTGLIEYDQAMYKIDLALDTNRTATNLNGDPLKNNQRVLSYRVQKLSSAGVETLSVDDSIIFNHKYNGLAVAKTLIETHFNTNNQAFWNRLISKDELLTVVNALITDAVLVGDTSSAVPTTNGINPLVGITVAFNKYASGTDVFEVTIENGIVTNLTAELVLSYTPEFNGVDIDLPISIKIAYPKVKE